MIISKCPLRVSLVGGSTDLQSFIDKYGLGKVISFPISLYTYISLSPRFDKNYKIDYSSQEECLFPQDIKNDIARELILYFNLPPVTIAFNADIPTTGSGLAASSSYMVAAVAAACKFKNLKWSQFKICKIAHEIELKFNPLTGYQDTYGCGLPSSKLMLFNRNVSIKFIDLPDFNMFLYNTQHQRSSTNILKTLDIKESYPLLNLVDEVYDSLGNSDAFFKLLRNAWETKKKLSTSILNSPLLKSIDKSLTDDAGVKFHKLCGAGGGGYYLIMSSHPNRQDSININIDNKGVVVWKI